MINEQWIGEDKGSSRGLISAIFLEVHAGVGICSMCVLHGEHVSDPGSVSYTLFCQFSSHSQCPSVLASLLPVYIYIRYSTTVSQNRDLQQINDSQTYGVIVC